VIAGVRRAVYGERGVQAKKLMITYDNGCSRVDNMAGIVGRRFASARVAVSMVWGAGLRVERDCGSSRIAGRAGLRVEQDCGSSRYSRAMQGSCKGCRCAALRYQSDAWPATDYRARAVGQLSCVGSAIYVQAKRVAVYIANVQIVQICHRCGARCMGCV